MYVAYERKTYPYCELDEGQAGAEHDEGNPNGVYIEGSRLYKANVTCYKLFTRPADAELVLGVRALGDRIGSAR